MINIFKKNKSPTKGFTLVEMLIVIVIIAIISGVAITAVGGKRSRARDARRRVDVRTIRTALELYYERNGHYPTYSVAGIGYPIAEAFNGASPVVIPAYLGSVPKDPGNPLGGNYEYVWADNGLNYGILIYFESGTCKYRTPGGGSGWWGVSDCLE
ncbi:MAG: hypothetical protein A3J48_02270 [Candidatus Doudnabacteria bacterium RIFCSPHIGHO2_02_FULL_46_11]|uniref:Type II secretion system protein GspG C-terminal domain-containing protein n=1 Tax=Candidatus Doudnabacteria bacterium RIFCSPHIGHO2_02_FULL_46_11 TaxID=1817832 RepID=A0A1F5P8P0_9BACT|nr:MAG: hypothetical protein A3J48_02270 [Candidatus Doudnabacteria bacterium RIFCSPHIGHO2_02_FULL_46_11]